MDSTPLTLLQRLRRSDDSAAWDRFVTLYTPLLFHWLRRAGLSDDDAADLVQDILTKLVVHMKYFSYDRSGSFHAWLRALAMNARRDLAKKKTPVAGGPDFDAFVPDPLDSFIEREYRRNLAVHAMRILKADFQPHTWQAVWDLVVEGKSGAEVAQARGMTIEAVYAAKCRVLARLRQELQGLWV